jgi:hypothetical protein
MAQTYLASCHCGNLSARYECSAPPAALPLRACACGFCRKHNARTTSDPKGRAEIVVRDPAALTRYRFGQRTADFLVCGNCGVYLGALFTDEDGKAYVTLNANTFANAQALPDTAEAVHYDKESVAEKNARRRVRWTPASLRIAGAD